MALVPSVIPASEAQQWLPGGELGRCLVGAVPVLMPFFTWVLLKVVPGTVIRKGLMGGEDERAGNSCKFLI